MKDSFLEVFEIIMTIVDIFNNPIGIASVIIAFILGGIMCRFAKLRTLIICVFSCFFIAGLGFLSCIVGNTPDYLWVPLFFLPLFVIMTVYCIIKLIINIARKKK